MTPPPTRRPPHPYACRHLAAHAAAGGRLDDVLNLETLPYLDEARLSTLLRLSEPTPLSPQWLLLSAFRSIRHRWAWDDPDANAAALDVAHLAVDAMAPLPDRWTASGLTWKPRLAEWQSGGTIVAGEHRSGHQLAIGAVQGDPLLGQGTVGRCACGIPRRDNRSASRSTRPSQSVRSPWRKGRAWCWPPVTAAR